MSSFIGVRHVGLAPKNPTALATFYHEVMGMTVMGESSADSPFGASLFLSSRFNHTSQRFGEVQCPIMIIFFGGFVARALRASFFFALPWP